jgi:hypothetical protein
MAKSTMKRFCATALFGLLISTAAVPVIAQSLDELAARGEILATADPLATELRERLDAPGRRGFDIGMGVAEGHTAPGPGKQKRGEELPLDQQAGYFPAVEFSVTRNANAVASNVGARIALSDPRLAQARLSGSNPFYALGFDIATGLLSDRNGRVQSPLPDLVPATVHGSLRGATKSGFEASASLHGRNFGSLSGGAKTNPFPAGSNLGTTDGSVGVDRVGSVPNVVGLRAADAEAALGKAGYKFTEVTVKGAVPRPPFDVVTGTVPPAGTTLVAGSNVRYQTVEAAILNGTGTLNNSDFDNRLGFDLDTGKYAQVTHGADMYMVPYGPTKCTDFRRQGERDTVTCYSGGSFLEPGDGARVVIFKEIYDNNRHSGNYIEFNRPLKSRHYFSSCLQAFQVEPLKIKIGIYDYFIDRTNSFGDRELITAVCVRTAEGNLSIVRFAPQERNGNFQFEFALFPDYPVLKKQGRVKVDPVPGAPAKPKLTICEMAKVARDRNSPAAPGLTKQCLDSGGTVPQ